MSSRDISRSGPHGAILCRWLGDSEKTSPVGSITWLPRATQGCRSWPTTTTAAPSSDDWERPSSAADGLAFRTACSTPTCTWSSGPPARISVPECRLLGPYAQNFNHRHDREGHLFRARFYSRRIQSESHLVSTLTYVALNPVRAGLVERPEQWLWSSYAATIGRSRSPDFFEPRVILELVDRDPIRAQLRFELAVVEARRVIASHPGPDTGPDACTVRSGHPGHDEGGLPTSFVSSPYRRNWCRRPCCGS